MITSENTNTETCPLKFRNYVPRSKELKQYCIPKPTIDDLEKKLEEDLQRAIKQSLEMNALSQVAPRKPNWDLKRDVQKKLLHLSRQTDVAMLQLIKMKLADKSSGDISRSTDISTSILVNQMEEDMDQNLEDMEDESDG